MPDYENLTDERPVGAGSPDGSPDWQAGDWHWHAEATHAVGLQAGDYSSQRLNRAPVDPGSPSGLVSATGREPAAPVDPSSSTEAFD